MTQMMSLFPQTGSTALFFASQQGHNEIVKLLFEFGASTEFRTKVRYVINGRNLWLRINVIIQNWRVVIYRMAAQHSLQPVNTVTPKWWTPFWRTAPMSTTSSMLVNTSLSPMRPAALLLFKSRSCSCLCQFL